MKKLVFSLAGVVLGASSLLGAESTMLHCFAFTPVESASSADWDAFYKATTALPGKVQGLKRVWAGKLARPMAMANPSFADADTRKKAMDAGKGTGDYTMVRRQYGVCMEFENEAAFKSYGPNAAHKEWEAVYGKVRVPGTTTFQLLPQQ